jgi:hypothetical protein
MDDSSKDIRIISFSGFGNSGKDFVCSFIWEHFPELSLKRFALADYLKELIAIVLGVTVEEVDKLKDSDPEFRQRIIDFNFGGLKKYDPNMLVKYFIQKFEQNPFNYIITDIRYPGEKQYLERWAKESCWSVRFNSVYIKPRLEDQDKINFNCGMSILPSQCDLTLENNSNLRVLKENLKDILRRMDLL